VVVDSAGSADGPLQASESDAKANVKHSKKTKNHMKGPKGESDTKATMKHKKMTKSRKMAQKAMSDTKATMMKHTKSSINKLKMTRDQKKQEDPTTRLLS
jgi:ribosomal protein L14E/L6E/L27E